MLFKITRRTYWYPYVSFGRPFVLTKGKFNDFLSHRLTKIHPPYAIHEAHGILGKLDKIDSIVGKIREDGYFISESKLSSEKGSLFGASYENIDLRNDLSPDVRNYLKKYGHSFQRFRI
jgi:hypothetical protein